MERQLKQSTPQQATNVCVTTMSRSLKERLKKCGRYHSNAAKDQKVITQIPTSSAAEHCSISPVTTRVEKHSSLGVPNYSKTEVDYDTPKRKSVKLVNEESLKKESFVLKKRRIEYNCDTHAAVCTEDLTQRRSNSLDVSEGSENIKYVTETSKTFPSYDSPISHYSQQNLVSLSKDPLTHGQTFHSTNNRNDQKIHCEDLKKTKRDLEMELKKTEEQLRKLKMIKMYREKNDLTELQGLINIWREVSQKALVDLLDLHPPPKPTMTELITHLQIDPSLVSYDTVDEGFL